MHVVHMPHSEQESCSPPRLHYVVNHFSIGRWEGLMLNLGDKAVGITDIVCTRIMQHMM